MKMTIELNLEDVQELNNAVDALEPCPDHPFRTKALIPTSAGKVSG